MYASYAYSTRQARTGMSLHVAYDVGAPFQVYYAYSVTLNNVSKLCVSIDRVLCMYTVTGAPTTSVYL